MPPPSPPHPTYSYIPQRWRGIGFYLGLVLRTTKAGDTWESGLGERRGLREQDGEIGPRLRKSGGKSEPSLWRRQNPK